MGIRWVGLLCGALICFGAGGQGRDTHIPKDLEDWQDWVLHGEEHRRCPFLYNSDADKRDDFICAWPGPLELSVTAQGGRFSQEWTTQGGEQWVPLPGGADVWPTDLEAGGRSLEVVQRDAAPSVRLAPGRHEISGSFAWDQMPATLAVPRQSGLLVLTVDGARIPLPRRSDQGVWLGEGERAEAIQDEMSTNVYRRIEDQVPTRLETVVEIEVSGAVREERFSPALPEGFVPLSLASELPVRLSPDGDLEAQVRPGRWRIEMVARAGGVADSVTLPQPETNLPSVEIWSYAGNPRLRATLPEGGRSVDPTQVGSPWEELPAFRIEPGESLAIVEHNRGLAGADNDLDVSRKLWLDFDGGGFVFADDITGVMRVDWRLDMGAPYALLGVAEGNRPLLITRNGELTGVEVRQSRLGIGASGRIETRGRMPVSGWQADIETLDATLNLPPGYKLLTALGVDNAASSWIGGWRLLDFFLVLIVSVAAMRLFGRIAGVVALVVMTLTIHEPGAPLWTWLNLLAAVALVRVAPAGRLKQVANGYRITSFIVLVLFLVPFAMGQIRTAMFPQLEPLSHRLEDARTWGLMELLAGRAGSPFATAVPEADPGVSETAADVAKRKSLKRGVEEVRVTAVSFRDELSRYADDALLQTGAGNPDWTWTPYSLSWSGPVDADRTMRFVILPDWLVGLLRCVAVGALGVFAAYFAFDIRGRPWQWPLARGKGRLAGASVAAVCLAGAVVLADSAWADPPPAEVLRELKERLLAPPSCTPNCAEIVDADVVVGEAEMTVRLTVHVIEDVAVPLPSSAEGWRPSMINDGEAFLAAHRDTEGVLWVSLEAGRHELTVRGPLPSGDRVEIPFALPPRVIAARSDHWFVSGIQGRTLAAGALSLTRLRREGDGIARWEPSRLPVFLRLERHLRLGLDWRAFTFAERVAPMTGAINVDIPLIEGEAVIDEDVVVGTAGVQVALDPTDRGFGWQSALSRRATMTLTAPTDRPWQEVWHIDIGNPWTVQFEGIPQSLPTDGGGRRVAVFHPRPGETLTVSIARPEGLAGDTLAFDEVSVRTTLGAHQRRSTMDASYRSSRGTSHRIRLPSSAQLDSVIMDGRTEPVVAVDGELVVPVLPGEHTMRIAWTEAGEPGLRVHTPTVDLGAPASDIITTLEMPSNRWLLWTGGPTLGPAVLYWPELVALILIAIILGRLQWTPLRTHHWLLLSVGFSTSSWLALAVVVAWLIAHGTRRSWGAKLSEAVYRLSQIGFGLLTLAAFAAILAGVGTGLLGNPDMHVTGFSSSGGELRWFADRTTSVVPQGSALSVPLGIYKGMILAWALWLSFAFVRWLPWVWRRFAEQGLWYRTPPAE